MDFSDSCMRGPCASHFIEDVDQIPVDNNGDQNSEDDKYVTRTFHWTMEDFPLEVATYMQCEEPWETDPDDDQRMVAMRARAKANASSRLQPDLLAGRRCSGKLDQAAADDVPDDMLEDELSVKEGLAARRAPRERSASSSRGRGAGPFQSATTAAPQPVSAACARMAKAETLATSSAAGTAPVPTHDLLDVDEPAPGDKSNDWSADWSAFAPPAPEAAAPAPALRSNREEELAAQVNAQAAEIERLKKELAAASGGPATNPSATGPESDDVLVWYPEPDLDG